MAILGLGIDVIGAIVLAVPDVPTLRERTKQSNIEQGISLLESSGLHPFRPGFDQIRSRLEYLYDIEIGGDVEGLRVGMEAVSRNPKYKLYIYPEDGDSWAPERDMSWPTVRGDLASMARRREMRFRAVGLGLLAFGFLLQIFSKLL